jgi:hypothetical protein
MPIVPLDAAIALSPYWKNACVPQVKDASGLCLKYCILPLVKDLYTAYFVKYIRWELEIKGQDLLFTVLHPLTGANWQKNKQIKNSDLKKSPAVRRSTAGQNFLCRVEEDCLRVACHNNLLMSLTISGYSR